MLESRFGSIISKSSTDVGRTKLHTLDVQVTKGSPVCKTIHYTTEVSKFYR